MIIGHIFFSSSRLWQTALKQPSVDCYVWEYQLASFIMCDKAQIIFVIQMFHFNTPPPADLWLSLRFTHVNAALLEIGSGCQLN